MDKKTLEKINLKHKLCKKVIARRGSANREEYDELRRQYNKVRNQVKSQTNKLKRAFELDLARKAKNNPKMIWQYINSKSKTRSGIGDLAIDPDDPKSDLTNDNAAKAEILSNFFNRVFTREPDDEVPYIPPKEIHQHMLPLIITEDAAAKLLRKLKVDKSPGRTKCNQSTYR